MHVAFVNKYYFPPHLGGVEQSLNLLAGSLTICGITVSALVANETRRTLSDTVDGVRVQRMGRLMTLASTPIAPGLRSAIRRLSSGSGAADIFHLQFPYPWGEVAWLTSGTRVPTVLTYHADVVRQATMMKFYAPMLRRVLDRVDRIIVGAPQLIEHSPFLAPLADKCRVVPFGIDLSRFAPDVAARKKVAAVIMGMDRPIILFVGRLVYYKGVDVLLDAMRDVDAMLVCIGTGPLEAELREQAVSAGVASRVVWLPPLPDEELAAWYEAADVLCLPSVARSEAFGLVQLEAHQAGTPVVSTDLPSGVPFVNQHEVTGLIVPPADARSLSSALTRILSDNELRARLGEQARRRVHEEFSVEAMVRTTLAVYSEVTGGAKRAQEGG